MLIIWKASLQIIPTKMAGDDIEAKIAYHEQMEHAAIQASNYAKAAHHRNMQNILLALKARQKEEVEEEPFKTPEQISDEDYKEVPTSADSDTLITIQLKGKRRDAGYCHLLLYTGSSSGKNLFHPISSYSFPPFSRRQAISNVCPCERAVGVWAAR